MSDEQPTSSSSEASPSGPSEAEVREILTHDRLSVPHYSDLHWRLDVPVRSSTLYNIVYVRIYLLFLGCFPFTSFGFRCVSHLPTTTRYYNDEGPWNCWSEKTRHIQISTCNKGLYGLFFLHALYLFSFCSLIFSPRSSLRYSEHATSYKWTGSCRQRITRRSCP